MEKLNKQAKELRHGLDKFRLEIAALEDQNKALKQQVRHENCILLVYIELCRDDLNVICLIVPVT